MQLVDHVVQLISPPGSDSLWKQTYVLAQMFFFSTREISEMRGPTGVKFCTMVRNRPNFIMPVQNFWGAHPKKILGAKNMQNLA